MRVHCWFVAAAFILIAFGGAVAQSGKPPVGTLTVEDVLKFSKAGLSDDIIVTRIKGNAKPFDLIPDEIQELKRLGISDAVIKVMLDPSSPYAPPLPPSPPVAPPVPPPPPKPVKKVIDPVAEKVPPEPGVYYSPDPAKLDFQRLEFKSLAATKQGGKLSKVLSAGLKKPTVVAFAVGQSAKVQVKSASPTFYVRLVERAGIEEYMLVMLGPGPNRRELELGPDPAKPVFPASALKQSQAMEVDSGLCRVSTASLERGEYLIYLLGSADEKKGILAKGYEFGVQPLTAKSNREIR
jgi:hypothetical protein